MSRPLRKTDLKPLTLTLKHYLDQGFEVDVVERWIPGPNGRLVTTKDLYGFGDLLAFGQGRLIIIQATQGDHHAEHYDKIIAEPRASSWIGQGLVRPEIELVSWAPPAGVQKPIPRTDVIGLADFLPP